jgi:predicted PurR-regulated permease PerM
MDDIPTPFQRRTLWVAITALSLTMIAGISLGLIYGVTQVLAVMQPFLVPFAIAAVLAYLLEPGVGWLERQRRMSRQRAVLLVFAVFSLFLVGMGWWLGAKAVRQFHNMEGKLPVYAAKVHQAVRQFSLEVEERYGVELLPGVFTAIESAVVTKKEDAESGEGNAVSDGQADAGVGEGSVEVDQAAEGTGAVGDFSLREFLAGDWVKKTLPTALTWIWSTVKASLGGFLGAFGLMISMVIIPLYLYYFLIESAKIKETWANYLPLRASAFKDELADCLLEINGYLVAFFRGQLFVSAINGVATGIGLMIVGLDFGLLIGLLLCVMGIIPYLGIAICWLPAVAIAAVQGGSALVPGDPWWALPLVVTIIFAVVQQIDGFFISPKIVGESVGLHPMTVIVSVVVWSLLLGGLLGAILAVPLTASVKVLFQRYVWLARLAPQTVGGAGGRSVGE